MKNFEIAFIFSDIADMLEIKGENFFKVRAYRKAAHVIGNLPADIQDIMKQAPLEEIEGIGRALSEKIQEILKTGTCRFYEELKKEFPRGLVEMLRIPGLGAKKIKVIYDTLRISSIDELEQAAKSHQLRVLPGMGVKTEETILKGIKMFKGEAGKTLLSTGLVVAEDMVAMLKTMTEIQNIEITGSLRRRKELIGDIDILASSDQPEDVIQGFLRLPRVNEVLAKGSTKASVRLDLGIQVDLRVVEPRSFHCALQYFTGSKDHNTKLRSIARKKGFKLNEYCIYEEQSGKAFYPDSEKKLYHYLEIPYIIPELREDRGEIEAAMEGRLPRVLEWEDIRGDLHVHTDWSDGISSIEAMADAAKALGYEYIAITDHSKSLKVARGLDEKRLKEQIDIIKKLNKEIEGIRILTGIEVDILSNEIMDFDDDILKELDVVVASIHTGFKQDRDKLTRRIISACENPHVDIIAHPTGRMLGKRDPYDIDLDLILKAAAETHTILEINSSPDRLDLNDIMANRAKEMGVKISIDTDAHEKEGLKDMRYGVWNARRAWLEKDDVLNTLPLDKLLKELSAR
ncbi:MAG: polymerase [Thermoanaerobacteraceae bacterium]|jgi:DNA polymerase (family 10)|uniref:DNA polymerase beta n=1 Tax=Biomaibacter acetigenes TaxID=2316383 RepID=A0A3G2R5F5_9FIRM|nr:DNA polymerase/3'-5' exonuclease PolX [Biomaibacter acetigenes]AYO30774.1 DNA polymerase/3'-5' exonuclease PolX [Biomaibacter acetigenes]MDK2879031.1 polymerase [Thermoanaerobacteraceae bacterium]MDN5302505.1 polymerase [Thermoanaerobacteraceae bacterium]MDN5312458.1 polymerase [Thermoanaerobacteraceae bacterium]